MREAPGPMLVVWPRDRAEAIVTALPPSFEGKVLTLTRLLPLLPEARWRVMHGDLRSQYSWDAA